MPNTRYQYVDYLPYFRRHANAGASSAAHFSERPSITSNIEAAAPLGMLHARRNNYFILFCHNLSIRKSSGGTVTRGWSIDWPR
jgi:hypothetical protein